MRLLALLVVLALPSCSFIESLKRNAARTADLADTVGTLAATASATLTDAKATYASAAELADTDGDGKTSTSEWMAYLLTLIGVAVGAVAEGRRRVGVRNAESDARKTVLEDKVAKLEALK